MRIGNEAILSSRRFSAILRVDGDESRSMSTSRSSLIIDDMRNRIVPHRLSVRTSSSRNASSILRPSSRSPVLSGAGTAVDATSRRTSRRRLSTFDRRVVRRFVETVVSSLIGSVGDLHVRRELGWYGVRRVVGGVDERRLSVLVLSGADEGVSVRSAVSSVVVMTRRSVVLSRLVRVMRSVKFRWTTVEILIRILLLSSHSFSSRVVVLSGILSVSMSGRRRVLKIRFALSWIRRVVVGSPGLRDGVLSGEGRGSGVRSRGGRPVVRLGEVLLS